MPRKLGLVNVHLGVRHQNRIMISPLITLMIPALTLPTRMPRLSRTASVGELLDVCGEAFDRGLRVGVLAKAEVDLFEQFIVHVLCLFWSQHQLLTELLDLPDKNGTR